MKQRKTLLHDKNDNYERLSSKANVDRARAAAYARRIKVDSRTRLRCYTGAKGPGHRAQWIVEMRVKKMPKLTAELLGLRMIWDAAPHNAFTDLVRHRGSWLCAFREGASHALCPGKVRVLISKDGSSWESAALIAERAVDLRDPKFSHAPGGRLELLMGGSPVRQGRYEGRRPRICSSADGLSWTPPLAIAEEGDWLWRIDRAAGRSYGISYRLPSTRRWTVHLLESADGLDYRELAELGVRGKPNEATLRFRGREAIALVRREAGNGRSWIGASMPPYRAWTWSETEHRLGGPNFIVLPGGTLIAAARIWRRGRPSAALCAMTEKSLSPILLLPSGGDCGYPGMVFHRGVLWISLDFPNAL